MFCKIFTNHKYTKADCDTDIRRAECIKMKQVKFNNIYDNFFPTASIPDVAVESSAKEVLYFITLNKKMNWIT